MFEVLKDELVFARWVVWEEMVCPPWREQVGQSFKGVRLFCAMHVI